MVAYFSFLSLFISRFLEATGMDRCNGISTPNRVEAPLGTEDYGPDIMRD